MREKKRKREKRKREKMMDQSGKETKNEKET